MLLSIAADLFLLTACWVAVNVMLIGTDLPCTFLLFSVDLSGFVLITASDAAVPGSSGAHVLGELPLSCMSFHCPGLDNLIAVRRQGDLPDPVLAS